MSASLSVALLVSMALLLAEKSTRAWMPFAHGLPRPRQRGARGPRHFLLRPLQAGSGTGTWPRGGTAQVGPYTVTLSDLDEGRDATFEFIEAELQLSRDGSVVGTGVAAAPPVRQVLALRLFGSHHASFPRQRTRRHPARRERHEGRAAHELQSAGQLAVDRRRAR